MLVDLSGDDGEAGWGMSIRRDQTRWNRLVYMVRWLFLLPFAFSLSTNLLCL